MDAWLVGPLPAVGYVTLSALLIYLSTVIAIRLLGERRTLAQMTVFDFAVAVALGTIIGRTATTSAPSYLEGITAVVTLLVVHNTVSWIRVRLPATRRLFSRGPLVLVRDGRIDRSALHRAHLTDDDLATVLRQHGVSSLRDAHLVVLESRGAFSVIEDGSTSARSV